MLSLADTISPEQWTAILMHAQENGLGAVRSQGFGTFDVTDMVRLKEGGRPPIAIRDEE